MAFLLRWTLLTALLLRIAVGGAWAMPLATVAPGSQAHTTASASALPPCHGTQAEATVPLQSTPDTHLPAGAHTVGAHCVLCFPATSSAFLLPLLASTHSMPLEPMAPAIHWQRAPELRPPI